MGERIILMSGSAPDSINLLAKGMDAPAHHKDFASINSSIVRQPGSYYTTPAAQASLSFRILWTHSMDLYAYDARLVSLGLVYPSATIC